MSFKSTKNKAQQVIDEINMQDHTQISIDKFLLMEQLIGELSQDDICFPKLRKYGCPSDFISCVFECKGNKAQATPSLCSKCWENALTEDIHMDNETTTPVTAKQEDTNIQEQNNPTKATLEALIQEASDTQTPTEEPLAVDDTDYSDVINTEMTGANYFASAAQSIREQFSGEKKKNKKPFFKKPDNKSKPIISEYDKLKDLELTPEQIRKVFELLEWDTIRDFDLLCEILTKP